MQTKYSEYSTRCSNQTESKENIRYTRSIIIIILTIHINQMSYAVQRLLCHLTETTYRNTLNANDSFTSLTQQNGETNKPCNRTHSHTAQPTVRWLTVIKHL